jgi:hypothetical protein
MLGVFMQGCIVVQQRADGADTQDDYTQEDAAEH